jgi:small ligand-binding sensory domain FIST
VRPVLAVESASGSISLGDRVHSGQTVCFHIRDHQTAEDDLAMMLDREQLRDPVKAALLFTCNVRGTRFFSTPDHDASTVSRRLHTSSLAGFQCAGEIGPQGKRSFVHTQTASVVLFRNARAGF